MKHIYVIEMKPRIRVVGFYIISALSRGITLPDGHDYWQIMLSDKTGDIHAYVRECPAVQLDESDVGRAVFVDGTVRRSDEEGLKLMCSFESLECIDIEDLPEKEMGYILAAGPFEPFKLMRSVEAFVASIDDADYRALCQLVLENNRRDLLSCPATRSDHHIFAGGLLVHTEHMLHLAEQVTALYSDGMFIKRDILLAGTLLHDIGRIGEFESEPIDDSIVVDTAGPELHEIICCLEIDKAAAALNAPTKKFKELKQVICAHHRCSVDLSCAEAVALQIINDLDAALETCRELAEVQA